MKTSPVDVDVAVIGGSYAACRPRCNWHAPGARWPVVDAGVRRNRFASTSHGFLRRGRTGARRHRRGRATRRQRARPIRPRCSGSAAAAEHADGTAMACSRSTGWRRDHPGARVSCWRPAWSTTCPTSRGSAERWGTSVFHCPYCHGYELDRGRIGAIATGPPRSHQAMMLPDWGSVTFFTNGAFAPDAAQRRRSQARGVAVDATSSRPLVQSAPPWRWPTAARTSRRAIHRRSHPHRHPLPAELGCAFDEGPLGIVHPHRCAQGRQTVPACSPWRRAARRRQRVAGSVGDGARRGFGAPLAALRHVDGGLT